MTFFSLMRKRKKKEKPSAMASSARKPRQGDLVLLSKNWGAEGWFVAPYNSLDPKLDAARWISVEEVGVFLSAQFIPYKAALVLFDGKPYLVRDDLIEVYDGNSTK